MDEVFLKILNMSISAGWLVLAVLVLRLLLKKAPKWMRILLWAAVGVRLVLPFSLESSLSLMPSAQTVPGDIVYAMHPAIDSGVPIINAAVNPVLGSSLAATPQYSANPIQKLLFVAAILWVVGMVALTVFAFVSWLRIRLRVREAVREDGVWVCDRIPSPFILGVFFPRIYLPSDLSGKDREYVLAHERAHLRRGDHLWKPLGFVLLTVHWFNPLLWVGYWLLCRDIELACDEKVMAQLGEEAKKPYADALINCSVPRSLLTACPLAFGENGVKGRLKAILHYKKPAFWIVAVAIIACVAVGVCFLTDPAQPSRENPPATVLHDKTKPPMLTVFGPESSVQAVRLSFDWTYPLEDGKLGEVIGCGIHPTEAEGLPLLEVLPISYSHRKPTTVALEFERLPDRITVTCYTPEGEQVLQTEGVQAFDLLEGTYVYGILAEWEESGKSEYAFRGSYNLPQFGYIPSEIDLLRLNYPQYFDLPTYQGLDVYIWQMAEGSYSCGLLRGETMAHTKEEIWGLIQAPLSMPEMRLILSTYNIDRTQIRLHSIRMLHSSYWYEIDDAYKTQVENLFWGLDDWNVGMSMYFTEGTKFRLTITATDPPREATMYTGSQYAVVKCKENGELEKLATKPDLAWDLVAWIILPDGGYTQEGDLSIIYGELETGLYQLQKTVTREYADGRREERIYFCYFAITD